MRPLSPAERAAILAEHPEASEADLDRMLALIARRAARPPEPGRRIARMPEDDELAALEAERFPRLHAALKRAQGSGPA
jgi:hypothetical protein